MERIASFEQFKRNGGSVDGSNQEIYTATNESGNDERKHYMFFRNLATIKHHVEEILKMDPDKVDELLNNGHDWASDHIATSKDDVQEVSEWLLGEFEMGDEEEEETEEEETEEEETDSDEEIETEEETEEEEPEGEEDENTQKQQL